MRPEDATDAILYEFDCDYRLRAKVRQPIALWGATRRVHLQKKVFDKATFLVSTARPN